MLELAFIVCLNISINSCEQKSLLYQDMNIFNCILTAQTELAKYVNEHPNVHIKTWSCKVNKGKENET